MVLYFAETSSFFFSYRHYFGTIIPHQKAAVFTTRRAEMVEVMDQTLHFLNRQAMVWIYSPYSDVPRHVSAHFHLVVMLC